MTRSERTKAGIAARRAHGLPVGEPPFGYQVVDGRMTVSQSEQKTINEILRLTFGPHPAGAGTVADVLNARLAATTWRGHIPAPRGARWHAESVRRVIKAALAAMPQEPRWRPEDEAAVAWTREDGGVPI